MYLTEIAQSLVDAINASSPDNWGGHAGSGLIVPTDVTAKFALDPFADSSTSELDIFVIPTYIEFDLTSKRKAVTPSSRRKFVTVAVVARIRAEIATSTYDVTSVAKAKEFIDLKEDLDYFIESLEISGATLKAMETEAVDELEIKDSFFITTTVCEYAAC